MAKLKQTDIFEEIEEHGLSLNQYYILCCIHDDRDPLYVNKRLDIRTLHQYEWLSSENQLTEKAIGLIENIELQFVANRARTPAQLMGKDYRDKIAEYRMLFPPGYRNSVNNLLKKFTKFFRTHRKKYSWDTIYKATRAYVRYNQVKNNHKYLQRSQYFIEKHGVSNLEDWCDKVLDRTVPTAIKPRFKAKVKH